MKKYLVFLLLGLFCDANRITKADCPTFAESGQLRFKCSENCSSEGDVFGTDYYHPDSSICRAAIHAGVLLHLGGEVTFSINVLNKDYFGSTSNRILSENRKADGNESFVFTSPKITYEEFYNQDSWLPDVYFLHNSYQYGRLTVACIYEDPTSENDRKFYRWNMDEFLDHARDRTNYITFTTSLSINRRIILCHGRHPIADVSGAVNSNRDMCSNANHNAVVATKGRPLTVNITCIGSGDSLKFLRHFTLPDKRVYQEGDPPDTEVVSFDSVSKKDSGFYLVGASYDISRDFGFSAKRISLEGNYFNIILRDCPPGKYGVQCQKDCRECQNEGVCHPLTGSCICKPGFNGTLCQTACEPNTYGSKCHLTCPLNLAVNPDFFGSSTKGGLDCRRITFCLPDPYGCSCMHGYGGKYCSEKVPLWLPVFAKGPKVTLQDGGVEVSFRKWDPSVDDGFTYNYDFSYYRLYIGEADTDDFVVNETYPYSSTKSNLYSHLSAEKSYKATVIIGLLNYMRDFDWEEQSRRRSYENATTYFTLPCLEPRNNSSLIISRQSEYMMELQAKIPRRSHEGTPFTCSFIVRDYSNGRLGQVIQSCKENYVLNSDDAAYCKFSSPISTPGERVLIEDYCENSVERCQSSFTESFMTPDLSAATFRIGDQVIIKKSYILQMPTTKLTIVTVKNDQAVLDEWSNYQKIMKGERFLDIDGIIENTAGINSILGKYNGTLDNFVTFDLKEIDSTARIYIILQYKDEIPCYGHLKCETWYYQLEKILRLNQISPPGYNGVYIGVSAVFVVLVLIVAVALFIRWKCQKEKEKSDSLSASNAINKAMFSYNNQLQMRPETLDISEKGSTSNSPRVEDGTQELILTPILPETCPDCLYDFDSKEGHCSNPDCMVAQGNLPPPPGLRTSPLGGPTTHTLFGRDHVPEDINIAEYDEVIPQGSLIGEGSQPQARTFVQTNQFPEPINFDVVYDDTINPGK